MTTTRSGLALALAVAVAMSGCGGDDDGEGGREPATQRERPALKTVTVRSVPPGKTAFAPERLTLKPGSYRVVLDNRDEAQHNVRIQAARKCCFRGEDVGGTETTSKIEKISGTAKLAPGEYVYLCTTHWREGMTGRLTVTS